MKIAEKVHSVPGEATKFVVEEVYDNRPALKQAEMLRHAGIDGMGESKLVGRIPVHLVKEWITEAGIKWDDSRAVQDVIRRKMLSGEFDKFRVWQGTY